jgi:hypothetical protein
MMSIHEHIPDMTLGVASATLQSLQDAADSQSLVVALKDLKYAIIGNTLRKVEVAQDERVLES